MAMRSQVYEWDAGRNGGGTLSYGQKYSIFIGGVGNNITGPTVQEPTVKSELTRLIISWTLITSGTMEFREAQALTQGQSHSSLPSTYTLMYMSCRDRLGMFYTPTTQELPA